MALDDILKPKSKEEIMSILEQHSLDHNLFRLMQESDPEYRFVTRFLRDHTGTLEQRVEQLNEFIAIIRSLR